MADASPAEAADAARDRAAEAWLTARHGPGWYLGEATRREWLTAYAAVDRGSVAPE